jgi:DNA-binding protein H-NS
MPTYKEYQSQIAELQALAEKARQDELAEARNKIRQLMREYDLAPQDLLSEKKGTASAKKGAAVQPRYRDPHSGATWSGRGRSPRWLSGRNKDDFLIK